MLSDRCLSCLSVTFVNCGQTAGWIKMPLGTEVGLIPGNIMLGGHISPALFVQCLSWPNGRPSQQLLSSWCTCSLTWRTVDHRWPWIVSWPLNAVVNGECETRTVDREHSVARWVFRRRWQVVTEQRPPGCRSENDAWMTFRLAADRSAAMCFRRRW